MPDSSTVHAFGQLLQYNPSWSLVTLLILGGLVYFLINLLKNTALTQKILDSVSTIHEIRADQLVSNSERKAQGEQIKQINSRLDAVESDIETIKCSRTDCTNRSK
jgi:hypothetical protein